MKKEFGRRAKARRELLKLTQATIAAHCETAISTIQRIEAGTLWPVPELFTALHKALKLPLGILATEGEMIVKPTLDQALEIFVELVRSARAVPSDLLAELSRATEVDLDSIRDILKAGRASREIAKGNGQKKPKKNVG